MAGIGNVKSQCYIISGCFFLIIPPKKFAKMYIPNFSDENSINNMLQTLVHKLTYKTQYKQLWYLLILGYCRYSPYYGQLMCVASLEDMLILLEGCFIKKTKPIIPQVFLDFFFTTNFFHKVLHVVLSSIMFPNMDVNKSSIFYLRFLFLGFEVFKSIFFDFFL